MDRYASSFACGISFHLNWFALRLKLDYRMLLLHEKADLIAALRRDIENERTKAAIRPEWEAYHLRNVRSSVRLLEAFGQVEDRLSPPSHGLM